MDGLAAHAAAMHCARDGDGNESWLWLFFTLQLLYARRATSCLAFMWQTSMVRIDDVGA